MNKAELIRHEIEKRRVHNLAIGNPLFAAMAEEDIELLSFIDSMQEEPVSEDLEGEVVAFLDQYSYPREEVDFSSFARHIAQWQKQQMKKDAIIVTIESDLDSHGADYGNQKIICGRGELEAKRFKNGSKVKLIIIKED